MKSKQTHHAVLLQPPPGDLTGPYPALCYLKSYAREHGYQVQVQDLGIDALRYLVQPEQVAAMVDRATAARQRLEAKRSMDTMEQHHYGALLGASVVADRPGMFADALTLFQDASQFYDYPRYKTACRMLDGFYRLLSAVHFPTVLTAAEYPTATMLKTMERILAHRDPNTNPFVRYYESVVFPQLAADPPALVGISMVFANQSVNALVLGYLIKERFPEIHVTLGGAWLSQWAMVADDAEMTKLFACTDSIVCGEGEQALVALLARTLANEPLDGLSNLIYLDPDSKQLTRFAQMNYTDISTQPPPDFSDLDLDLYLSPQKIIPYSISRGCYWGRCVFCQNRYGDNEMRRYQTVPVEKALTEMKVLSEQYQTNHFNFSNDVIDPAYMKKFSQAALDGECSYVWNTDLRAEAAFDAETCALMARAGLNSVAIGFESGCQKTLDAMDKGNRVETTRQVMLNLYQAGVATQAMGIFGFPGETEFDGSDTVQFIEQNVDRISYYVMGLLMVMPGSKMYENPAAHGVASISYATNPLKTPEPVWTSHTRMSIDSVNRLYERLNQLEEIFALDEYPYVGGLGTNHSFLYYTLGPDILKRLRREEQSYYQHINRKLGVNGDPPKTKTLNQLIPRLIMPYGVYRSFYAADKLPAGDANESANSIPMMAGVMDAFLISLHYRPEAINATHIALLEKINGKRSLKVLLKMVNCKDTEKALQFLWTLTLTDMMTFKKTKS